MILKKDSYGIIDPKDIYLKDRIKTLLSSINQSSRVFANDFYKILNETKDSIYSFINNNWKGLLPWYHTDVKDINSYFDNQKKLNALNNLRLQKLREYIELLGENSEKTAQFIEKLNRPLVSLLSEIEANVTNLATNSIRNEIYPSVKFNNFDNLNSNTLFINTEEGCLTIPYIETNKIPYIEPRATDIRVTGTSMFIRELDNNRLLTTKIYDPGYYFGNFFDISPNLSNVNNIAEISQDNGKNFYVETYQNTLVVEFTFKFPFENRIGTMHMLFGKCSSKPIIEYIKVKKTKQTSFSDITKRILPNGIVIKGVNSAIQDKSISSSLGNEFSNLSILINQESVTDLIVAIRIPVSELKEYIEYDLLDDENNIIRSFNYLESLYISQYNWPSDYTIEKAAINTEEINNLSAKGKLNQQKRSIEKKYLTLNKVYFSSIETGVDGSFVSINHGRNKTIDSVELYVDESIPEGLDFNSIKYYVSENGINYVKINPLTRSGITEQQGRISFAETGGAQNVKIKIEMTNQGTDKIPKVFGYILRIKEGFDL